VRVAVSGGFRTANHWVVYRVAVSEYAGVTLPINGVSPTEGYLVADRNPLHNKPYVRGMLVSLIRMTVAVSGNDRQNAGWTR